MPNGGEHFDQPPQHPHRHHRHHHHHHRHYGGTKWIAINLAAWIIGAVLIAYGVMFLLSEEGTTKNIIGGIMCFAGVFFVLFSKNLRKWLYRKL